MHLFSREWEAEACVFWIQKFWSIQSSTCTGLPLPESPCSRARNRLSLLGMRNKAAAPLGSNRRYGKKVVPGKSNEGRFRGFPSWPFCDCQDTSWKDKVIAGEPKFRGPANMTTFLPCRDPLTTGTLCFCQRFRPCSAVRKKSTRASDSCPLSVCPAVVMSRPAAQFEFSHSVQHSALLPCLRESQVPRHMPGALVLLPHLNALAGSPLGALWADVLRICRLLCPAVLLPGWAAALPAFMF